MFRTIRSVEGRHSIEGNPCRKSSTTGPRGSDIGMRHTRTHTCMYICIYVNEREHVRKHNRLFFHNEYFLVDYYKISSAARWFSFWKYTNKNTWQILLKTARCNTKETNSRRFARHSNSEQQIDIRTYLCMHAFRVTIRRTACGDGVRPGMKFIWISI